MSGFTRRHYSLISRAIKDARPMMKRRDAVAGQLWNVIGAHDGLDNAAKNLADVLGAGVPKFDRIRFLSESEVSA